jgi:ribokinase
MIDPKMLEFSMYNDIPHLLTPVITKAVDAINALANMVGEMERRYTLMAKTKTKNIENFNEKEKYLRDVLKENHVNDKFLRLVTSPTGMAFIQVNKEGENAILLNKGANFKFDLEQFVEILSHFNEGDTLVLQNEINELKTLIDLAHNRHLKIALNPSPFNQDILKLPLQYIDYLFINELEGEMLTNKKETDEILEVCKTLIPNCEVVLTLGSQGACVLKDNQITKKNTYKVEAIDSTGAGDTFTGFYLSSRVQNKSIEESLQMANAAAALSVTKKGAMDSIPSLDEVEKFIKKEGQSNE